MTKWPYCVFSFPYCLKVVKKKHTNIYRKTFANIRKIYYLCISKPTVKSHTKPSSRPKPLPLATFGGSPLPLWRGVNGLDYWKPPPLATFGGLPLPLTQGYSVLHFSLFTLRSSLFVLHFFLISAPAFFTFLPFYLFTFKNAFLPLKMPFYL